MFKYKKGAIMSNKLKQRSAQQTKKNSEVFNNLTDSEISENTEQKITSSDCDKSETASDLQISKAKVILGKVFKNLYVKGVLVTAILLSAVSATAFFAIHSDFKNNNVDAIDITVTPQTTQPATQKAVPATDETLNFKKNKYIIDVGESVKVSCIYTPPTEKSSDEPDITYTSNNIDIATVDDKGNVKGISTGTTSIVAVSDTGIYTTVPVTVTAPESHIIEDVPMLSQGDDYPSGCESVSSTMLLNYYGFEITTNEFIDEYLPMADLKYNDDGEMIAPDTYSAFIGSPYSEAALGCFPPVIKNAMNEYFEDKNYRAVDITGSSMESLTNNYIANNHPVLIWATMWMQDAFVTYEWTVKGAEKDSPYQDGDTYQWLANEHCMVLVGYDEDYYYLNDPLNYYTTAYSRSVFDDKYEQMGRCAIVIEEIE